MRNKYVIWSGGADSTLLLHRTAKKASESQPVYAVSFASNVITPSKTKKESQARRILLKKIKGNVQTIEVKLDVVGGPKNTHGGGLHQVNLWLAAILPWMKSESDLLFGYIRGDDFWHHKPAVELIFKGMLKISGLADVRLLYPLEWSHKHEVIGRLKELGLYRHTWTCEEPLKNRRPCNRCDPCLIAKRALLDLKLKQDVMKKTKTLRKK